jgi:hypothetical protein
MHPRLQATTTTKTNTFLLLLTASLGVSAPDWREHVRHLIGEVAQGTL